ncbi:hypothetical protein VTL71DRAFT_11771 [Oculimacula yallundae]|uniref:Heterokaryon incompatibility domain-containing protein n=1 Tax=Oculimacula yallundae TaxID=86028 RepID=A0ABR4CSU3_9HELO
MSVCLASTSSFLIMTDSNITSRLRKLRFGRRTSPTRSVPTPSKASSVSSQKSQTRLARIDIYRPLNPSAREIRLLHVLPEQPGSLLLGPDPISCVLSHVSLDDKPTYHALSYTWDDESLGQSFEDPDDVRRKRKVFISGFIFLDGQAVEVTPNLWAALWHLRRGANWFKSNPDSEVGEFGEKLDRENPVHFTYETPIWIDALCINQLDVAERNDQVQMMGSLYQSAQCVHSWTGLEIANTEGVIDLVEECYSKHSGSTYAEIRTEFEKVLLDQTLESHWKTLEMLCNVRYWHRLWVVQEFVLGRQCIIHIGLRAINSTMLTWFVRYTNINIRLLKKNGASMALPWNQMLLGFQTIQHRHMDREKATLSSILAEFGELECSDPRDKIYSLLGLGGQQAYDIQVDYTLDADTVYLNAVRTVIVQDRDLSMIYNPARYSCQCTKSQHTLSPLPSWVRDFRCLQDAYHGLLSGARFNPSGQDKAVITFTRDSNILVCRGLHVGTIGSIYVHESGSSTISNESRIQYLTRFTSSAPNALNSLQNSSPPSSDALLERLKLVYAAVTYNTSSRPTWDEATFIKHCTSSAHDDQPSTEDIEEAFGKWALLKLEALFCMTITSPLPGTNIDLVPAGPVFGKCYPFYQKGDIIVALYGCPLPIALRADPADQGRFKVLGEVCVPAFMRGQAVGMFEERDFELT